MKQQRPTPHPSGFAGHLPQLRGEGYAVPNLTAFFTGSWHLGRMAWDAGSGRFMRLTGTATFTPHSDGLLFEERGRMTMGAFHGETSRSYLFVALQGSRCEVRFADGRPFHSLDLADGVDKVRHDCAPDLYRGRYRVTGPDSWILAWRITGPRKNLVMVSRFARA